MYLAGLNRLNRANDRRIGRGSPYSMGMKGIIWLSIRRARHNRKAAEQNCKG